MKSAHHDRRNRIAVLNIREENIKAGLNYKNYKIVMHAGPLGGEGGATGATHFAL